MPKLRTRTAIVVAAVLLVLPGAVARAAPAPPGVGTAAATAETDTGATLNGAVNPNGQATQYAFQWGPTSGYGHETQPVSAGSATTALAVSAALTGLAPGSPYHFRIIAVSSAGTSTGSDGTFTTTGTAPAPSRPPAAATIAAAHVGASSATFEGTVNPDGQATSYHFEYGQTSDYGAQTGAVSAGAGTGSVLAAVKVGGLHPGTTYHFRVVAVSAGGTALGADASVRTIPPPAVITGGPSGVGSSSAVVNGTVNPLGHSTRYQFQFGPSSHYGLETPPASAGSGTGNVAVHQSLGGLAAGTTYHYRIVANSSGGTGYGADQSFRTTGGAQLSSRVSVLGRIGFVSPRGGFVGIVLACSNGPTRCTGHFTLKHAGAVFARRDFSLAPGAGGFQNVRLTPQGERALFRHYHGPVAVRIHLVTTSGQRTSALLHLARWY